PAAPQSQSHPFPPRIPTSVFFAQLTPPYKSLHSRTIPKKTKRGKTAEKWKKNGRNDKELYNPAKM
ncbi:MAG: hypothetical protein NC092_02640, partial [Butyrivibrio sp.]|nr:hypothetical protein [Butyrivibrio sp.]